MIYFQIKCKLLPFDKNTKVVSFSQEISISAKKDDFSKKTVKRKEVLKLANCKHLIDFLYKKNKQE
jgi:hypothetical protein